MTSMPFVAFLVLSAGTAGYGAIPVCEPIPQLERYLETHPEPSNIDVLALDHRTQVWSTHRWDGRGLDRDGAKLELRLDNQPRVEIPRRAVRGLRVFVIDTNPLLYHADATAVSEVDSEDLANVKQLASALGGGLSGLLTTARREEIASPALVQVEAVLMGRAAAPLFVIETPEGEEETAAQRLIEAVRVTADPVLAARRKLASVARSLESSVAKTEALVTTTISSAQLAETGRTVEPPVRPVDVRTMIDQLRSDFTRLERERSKLAAAATPCTAELSAIDDMLRIALTPPKDDRDRVLAIQERNRRNRRLRDGGENGDQQVCDRRLWPAIEALRGYLEKVEPGDKASDAKTTDDGGLGNGSPDESSTLNDLRYYLEVYAILAADRTSALTKAKELLAKRDSALKAATALLRLAQRSEEYRPVERCTLTAGVVEVERPDGPDKLTRFKVRKEGFKLTADPGLQAKVQPLRRTPLEAKYELVPATPWEFDLDFGAIYTDLASPEFGAVETETGMVDDAGKNVTRKLIARVDEDVKAGQVAVFGTAYRKGWPVGVQLGAAVDGDEPALLAGLALRLGPYVKLSGGVISAKVDDLARGLDIGDEVPDADSIRTHDEFAEDWYLALSVTLDNLSLFGGL